ncbi:plasmid mobilization protein [Salegentibacter sp. F14]
MERLLSNSNKELLKVKSEKPADKIPGGQSKKKKHNRKRVKIYFQCSLYDKKLLKIKAQHSGLSLSEFCRRTLYEKEVKERLSDDHIEIYKTLVKFHHNFKSISEMFHKKDSQLASKINRLANEIKLHLQKING